MLSLHLLILFGISGDTLVVNAFAPLKSVKRPNHRPPCGSRHRRVDSADPTCARPRNSAPWPPSVVVIGGGESSASSLRSLSSAAGIATGAAEVAASTAVQATKTAAGMATKTVTKGGAPFWQLAFAFTLGGIFFSTVAASITAVYAVGIDNCLRLWSIVSQLVARVWKIVRAVLGSTKDVLFGDYAGAANRFSDAWRTLREGFGEARRVAAEGVEAFKQESRLYAAAVGMPGLIPLQYALDRMTFLTMAGPMEDALRDALAGAADDPKSKVRRLKLKKFSMGDVAPRLRGARMYDIGGEDMAFDMDVKWDSTMMAEVDCTTKKIGAKIPVSVRNFRFEGSIRAVVTRLRKKEPGYGAILLSLPAAPKIGMDVRVAGGEVTRVPWLRSELSKGLQDVVASEVLWPRRIVLPALVPKGVVGVGGKLVLQPVLTSAELRALELDDPLLIVERMLNETLPKGVPRPMERADPNLPFSVLEISMDEKEKEAGSSSEVESENAAEERDIPWWRQVTKEVTTFQRNLNNQRGPTQTETAG